MFKSEGNFKGKIIETMLADPKFAKNDPDAFDVCLHLKGPDVGGQPQEGWWRGEISGRYGSGNLANKKQIDITMDELRKVGFEGDDLSQLNDQLLGKEIEFFVGKREYQGKNFYDPKYLGANGPVAIAPESIAAKMARIRGGASAPAPAKSSDADDTETDESGLW